MKIKESKVKSKDVEVRKVFSYKGYYYMKLTDDDNFYESSRGTNFNVVDLESGELEYFSNDIEVKEANVELREV